MKISEWNHIITRTFPTIILGCAILASLTGVLPTAQIEVVARQSSSEKREQQPLSASEIDQVQARCGATDRNTFVVVNKYTRCYITLPIDRSLPEDAIISIGNEYQDENGSRCTYSPSYDYYYCWKVYTGYKTGNQNIYIRLNGNTEPTGEQTRVTVGEKQVLPKERISELEVVCQELLVNSLARCNVTNIPEGFLLPIKASLLIGDTQNLTYSCNTELCNGHTGNNSGKQKAYIAYPGADKVQTKSELTVLSNDVTELDVRDYDNINVACQSAPVRSTTNCTLTLPENRVITNQRRYPIIRVDSHKYIDFARCSKQSSRIFTCNGLQTGFQIGQQDIYIRAGEIRTTAISWMDSKEDILVTDTETRPFTENDIQNSELTCNKKSLDIRSFVSCTLKAPEGIRLQFVRLSLGEDNQKQYCTLDNISELQCNLQPQTTGSTHVFAQFNDKKVKLDTVIKVERFETITQPDLENMNVRCADSVTEQENIGLTVRCKFTIPEGRYLPDIIHLRIQGTIRLAGCIRTSAEQQSCSISRGKNDTITGRKNIDLEIQGGSTFTIANVNFLDLRKAAQESERQHQEVEQRREEAQENLTNNLDLKFNFGTGQSMLSGNYQDTGLTDQKVDGNISYGWREDHTGFMREDTSEEIQKPAHSGLVGFAKFSDRNSDHVWTLEGIPNGTYRIEATSGSATLDPNAFYDIAVNNDSILKCKPSRDRLWCNGGGTIDVRDGKIEVKRGSNGNNVVLNLLKIKRIGS